MLTLLLCQLRRTIVALIIHINMAAESATDTDTFTDTKNAVGLAVLYRFK